MSLYGKSQEITLAKALKTQGYTTGHFGKWHIGTLTTKIKDANRGGPTSTDEYSPPWDNGFDECFSTESKVPAYDPMIKPAGKESKKYWNPVKEGEKSGAYNTRYWSGPGEIVSKNLEGDDSRIIMDRAIPFIEKAVKQDEPFLAVIWFHAPHWPVVGWNFRIRFECKRDEWILARNFVICDCSTT